MMPPQQFHIRSSVIRLCLLATAASLLMGCQFQSAPQLDLGDAMLDESTAEATRVAFVLEVTNPNETPLELRELEYQLNVDGRQVYSGRRAAQTTLPSAGNTQVQVPAVIPADIWQDGDRNYSLTGTLIYVSQGQFAELLLDMGLPRPRASFAGRGELAGTTESP